MLLSDSSGYVLHHVCFYGRKTIHWHQHACLLQYEFGPYPINANEVFARTQLSFAFVNLKPIVSGMCRQLQQCSVFLQNIIKTSLPVSNTLTLSFSVCLSLPSLCATAFVWTVTCLCYYSCDTHNTHDLLSPSGRELGTLSCRSPSILPIQGSTFCLPLRPATHVK